LSAQEYASSTSGGGLSAVARAPTVEDMSRKHDDGEVAALLRRQNLILEQHTVLLQEIAGHSSK
jgi:hypothetical protein